MKKRLQPFKKQFERILLLSPVAIMLMSANVLGQVALDEKKIAEGVILEESIDLPADIITSKRGPSVVDGSIEVIAENDKDDIEKKDVKESSELDELKKKLTKKELEIVSLKKQVDDISSTTKDEIETLELVITSSEKEILSLHKQIEDLKSSNESIKAEKIALEEKSSTLSKDLEKIKSDLAAKEIKIAKLEKENKALEEEKLELKKEKEELEIAACEQENKIINLEKQVSQSASIPNIMQTMMMMQQQNMMMMMSMMNSMSFSPSYTSGYQGGGLHTAMMLQSMQHGMQTSLFQNSIYSLIGAQNSMQPTYQFSGDIFNNNPYTAQSTVGQKANPAASFNPESLMGIHNPYGFNTGGNFGNIQGYMAPIRPKASATNTSLTIPTGTDAVTEAELSDDLEKRSLEDKNLEKELNG